MRRKKVDTLIPVAMRLIQASDSPIPKTKKENGKISSTYAGYLAAFGPTIRFAGLLQAMFYYQGEENRKHVLKLIEQILSSQEADRLLPANTKLVDYLRANNRHRDIMTKNRIYEAIVAAKLAIRMFVEPDKEDDHAPTT